jgi:hypothetical protein
MGGILLLTINNQNNSKYGNYNFNNIYYFYNQSFFYQYHKENKMMFVCLFIKQNILFTNNINRIVKQTIVIMMMITISN